MLTVGEQTEQPLPGLAGVRSAARRAPRVSPRSPATPAATDPVARLLLDLPVAHLDRDFDYLVPAELDDEAVPGARVKVRFGGREVHGFILERVEHSTHDGALLPLRRVVSAEPVLTPEIASLTALVAARYAGTRADVVRLAVPPRHARTEKEPSPPGVEGPPELSGAGAAWAGHRHGEAFVDHLAGGGSPRAVWTASPGTDWPRLLAYAAAATLASGRGTVLCVPDGADVDRVDAALTDVLGPGRHVTLRADAGPARRYREFLAVLRGSVKVVVGTRAAMFAPVQDLGLVCVWDDGDDNLAEPRAPYPHAREVLLTRAGTTDSAALVGGFTRSVEAAYLVRTGWAQDISGDRNARRAVQISVAGASDTQLSRDPLAKVDRIPAEARAAIRTGLEHGPVLVQTPRSGYATRLACVACRTPARCGHCQGPLRIEEHGGTPVCAWCLQLAQAWQCGVCGDRALRAPVVGERRTAEELGRAFPQIPVVRSGGDSVVREVSDRPAIVVATPGAEPVAAGGYHAVALLDAWLLLERADLRAGEEALRRWLNAVGLAAPGALVVVAADATVAAVQALVRLDPAGHAEREILERASAHLPPACRAATITGPPGAVDDVLALVDGPPGIEILGPFSEPSPRTGEETARVVLRVPRAQGPGLAAALTDVQRLRSVRKLQPVRIQLDPASL
ncbi:primosomal protein N' [Nocardioides limicola]|uniref:primosomal protein N' n=1 Tax=Nocardioides limicola TaxID=2803368 RepID=UPI00193BC7F7|nr:primosomal protein N' [Nocardioides sp. DJM-14]